MPSDASAEAGQQDPSRENQAALFLETANGHLGGLRSLAASPRVHTQTCWVNWLGFLVGSFECDVGRYPCGVERGYLLSGVFVRPIDCREILCRI